jgi:hypothetical protein
MLSASAQASRAKRGRCLQRVQNENEGRIFFLMFAVCLEFLQLGALLAREPIGQYRWFEIETLGSTASL